MPSCRELDTEEIVTKNIGSVTFTTSIIETIELAWPCNDDLAGVPSLEVAAKQARCAAWGADVVQVGAQCKCEDVAMYYVKGVEKISVFFEHQYTTSDKFNGGMSGSVETQVHWDNGTVRTCTPRRPDAPTPRPPPPAHRAPRTAHRTPHTAHRTPHTAHRTHDANEVKFIWARSRPAPAAPSVRDRHPVALTSYYGAPGLEADLLFSYRKSRSYVHFFTAPGALRPPHRDLSIDCKIFFCYKIGRTGRHACGGQWRCKGHAARAQREEKICTRRFQMDFRELRINALPAFFCNPLVTPPLLSGLRPTGPASVLSLDTLDHCFA